MKYKNEEREKEGFLKDKDSEFTQEKAMASNRLTILNAANSIFDFEKPRNFNHCEVPYAILSD